MRKQNKLRPSKKQKNLQKKKILKNLQKKKISFSGFFVQKNGEKYRKNFWVFFMNVTIAV